MDNANLIDDFDYPEPSQDERTVATFAHLGALASCFIPMGNIVLPLVIWLVKKDESTFIDEQAKEALNFQITMTLMAIVAGILCLLIVGFFLLFGLIVFDIVVSIIAAIKANEGKPYDYPINFRFIK